MLCGFFVRGNAGVIVWRNKSMYMEKLASAKVLPVCLVISVQQKRTVSRPLSLCKESLFDCAMFAVIHKEETKQKQIYETRSLSKGLACAFGDTV